MTKQLGIEMLYMGIAPRMLKCSALAIFRDFAGLLCYKPRMRLIRDMCMAALIPVLSGCSAHMERSYSGNGYRPGIDFTTPAPGAVPEVIKTSSLTTASVNYEAMGYIELGSMYVRGALPGLEELQDFARSKGAGVVLYWTRQDGTIVGSRSLGRPENPLPPDEVVHDCYDQWYSFMAKRHDSDTWVPPSWTRR